MGNLISFRAGCFFKRSSRVKWGPGTFWQISMDQLTSSCARGSNFLRRTRKTLVFVPPPPSRVSFRFLRMSIRMLSCGKFPLWFLARSARIFSCFRSLRKKWNIGDRMRKWTTAQKEGWLCILTLFDTKPESTRIKSSNDEFLRDLRVSKTQIRSKVPFSSWSCEFLPFYSPFFPAPKTDNGDYHFKL